MSNKRKQKFVDDAEIAEGLCHKEGLPFKDFTLSETTFSFVVAIENPKFDKCTICITDDYPENTFICKFKDTEQTEVSNNTLPVIMEKLGKELSSPHVMPDKLSVPMSTERSISMESSGSSYMDCKSSISSESEEEDMDYYYKGDSDNELVYKICPTLEKDMEKLAELYGEAAITYRLLDAIDEIDIQINLPLSSIIDGAVAEAWKLNREEPLAVCLHLSYTHYLDIPNPPKVEVFQTSRSEKNCISSQMKKVMESFVFHQWPKNSNKLIEEYRKHHEDLLSKKSEQTNVIDDRDLARIMEIGFNAEQARDALILSRGDLFQAIQDLFANKEAGQYEENVSKKEDKKVEFKHLKMTQRQKSVPHDRKKKTTLRQLSHSGSGAAISKTVEELSLTAELNIKPSTLWFGKNSKRIPQPEFGFLVQIFQYARQRLPTLNEYCVVCDEPHVFQNGAMLKPAVCSRELCIFAFQTLGVMSDAADDIATAAEVVDLLLTMTKAASRHSRRNIILDPFPTVVDPNDPNELALNPKDKEYDKVDRILKKILSMEEMVQIEPASNIKKVLDEKDKLCYPLLQWIITSNRSHIVKLPPEKRIPFMRTPFQFLLCSSPPAKEAKFREAKEKYGSTFAFHGSSAENWHSIIRQGLIVASGTNKQVNGAAYGKGIYLSPNAGTSFGYSRMYGSNKKSDNISSTRFLQANNDVLFCIALCEVITWDKLKKSGQIWVCPEPDYVCTRFFFVYEAATGHEGDIDTQKKPYSDMILEAVNYKYSYVS